MLTAVSWVHVAARRQQAGPPPGQRLRLHPTLTVLHWSDASGAYLDGPGKPVPLPAEEDPRVVTYLERHGRPMTALVHDPAVLDDPDLTQTVLAAVRFVVENERAYGQVRGTATDAAALPTGFVTLLMTWAAIGGSEPTSIRFRSLGRHHRPGLPDAETLLQVEADGLPASFPPPRTRGRDLTTR